jgi:hypothetical protein
MVYHLFIIFLQELHIFPKKLSEVCIVILRIIYFMDKIRKLNRQRGNVLEKIDINLTNKRFEY